MAMLYSTIRAEILFMLMFCCVITTSPAALLFQEGWQSGSIDTTKWVTHATNGGYQAVEQYAMGQ
jgi:hypothetical protein